MEFTISVMSVVVRCTLITSIKSTFEFSMCGAGSYQVYVWAAGRIILNCSAGMGGISRGALGVKTRRVDAVQLSTKDLVTPRRSVQAAPRRLFCNSVNLSDKIFIHFLNCRLHTIYKYWTDS